jgi:hypothetical protein
MHAYITPVIFHNHTASMKEMLEEQNNARLKMLQRKRRSNIEAYKEARKEARKVCRKKKKML